MKRLPLNKILIPLVLSIWGWVIWTYFGFSLPLGSETPSLRQSAYQFDTLSLNQDTFTLSLTYADPFLRTLRRDSRSKTTVPS
ncbi:MAG: hypothetical protein AAFR59_20425, partial [Bacteroidota bacterium]